MICRFSMQSCMAQSRNAPFQTQIDVSQWQAAIETFRSIVFMKKRASRNKVTLCSVLFPILQCIQEQIIINYHYQYQLSFVWQLSITFVWQFLRSYGVGFSKPNLHKLRHNFNDTIDQICLINGGTEDTEHFLLSCHYYDKEDVISSVLSKQYCYQMAYQTFPTKFCLKLLKLVWR